MVTRETPFYDQVCVIIPTYNNAETLCDVIEGVLRHTEHVIVVNDGSTDNTPEILQRFPALTVLSYRPNRGKGFALRTAFEAATGRGYKYAVTVDSDGQHFPNDLSLFFHKLKDYPESIIIGARNMEQANVPGKSSFGNKFSNFWFRFETGVTLRDTQSGYRLYPLELVMKQSYFTRKYEFEIEVLVRSAWSGVNITEIPIGVFYAEKGKRISHFRPFQDFSRISVLNTVLVTIALLYIKPRDLYRKLKSQSLKKSLRDVFLNPDESDMTKALSIAVGVFMGIAPIWGFQLMTAIGLAFLLRLNKPLVILSANISLPPLIPVIIFLSHTAGAMWMGENATVISFDSAITVETIGKNLHQYIVGALSLATASGAILGLFSYGLLKFLRR